MDIGISSIVVSLIIGVSSIITAFILGYVPRKRQEEIQRLRKELLEVYIGVLNLKSVEEDLEAEAGISKQSARKGLNITEKLQRNRIEKRIEQLQMLTE